MSTQALLEDIIKIKWWCHTPDLGSNRVTRIPPPPQSLASTTSTGQGRGHARPLDQQMSPLHLTPQGTVTPPHFPEDNMERLLRIIETYGGVPMKVSPASKSPYFYREQCNSLPWWGGRQYGNHMLASGRMCSGQRKRGSRLSDVAGSSGGS